MKQPARLSSSLLPLAIIVMASAATAASTLLDEAPAARSSAGQTATKALQSPPRRRAAASSATLARVGRVALPSAREALEMTFVGDIIFGRFRRQGFYDPIVARGVQPFAAVRELLASDLVVGNLETPLVRRLPAPQRLEASMRFAATSRAARALVVGGFDAVSVANNHAWDAGARGLRETPQILAGLGVSALGSGGLRIQRLRRRGYRIALLALTTHGPPRGRGVAHVRLDRVVSRTAPLLARARARDDVVVVLVHWGDEYADAPTGFRRSVAHRLVDAGADLVIGHHPHVLQGIERRGGALIAYSLGNFLFENVHPTPRLSAVLRVRFSRPGCLERATLHPAYIRREPRAPAPARAAVGRRVRRRVQRLSRRLGTRWSVRGDDLTLAVCGGGLK